MSRRKSSVDQAPLEITRQGFDSDPQLYRSADDATWTLLDGDKTIARWREKNAPGLGVALLAFLAERRAAVGYVRSISGKNQKSGTEPKQDTLREHIDEALAKRPDASNREIKESTGGTERYIRERRRKLRLGGT